MLRFKYGKNKGKPVLTKTCTKCKEDKEISCFHKNHKTKDGLSYSCKSCVAAYQRSEKGKASGNKGRAKYLASEKGKITSGKSRVSWQRSERGKASGKKAKAKQMAKPGYKEAQAAYNAKPERKEALAAWRVKREAEPGYKEAQAAYRAKYHQDNRGYRLAYSSKYQKSNPGRNCARSANYNAAKIQRTVIPSQRKEIEQFYIDCPDNMEVDHIWPMRGKYSSGLHVIVNLQYLSKSENCCKSNKEPVKEWEPQI